MKKSSAAPLAAADHARIRELKLRMSNIRSMRPLLDAPDRRQATALLMGLSRVLTGETVEIQELRLRLANVRAMRPLLDKDGLRQSDKLLNRLTQDLAAHGVND